MPTTSPCARSSAQTQKIDLAAEILRSGSPVRLRALGTSMLPSIWPGDLLTIAGVDSHAITVGDILCGLRSNRLFIHRLTRIQYVDTQIRFTTRGDCAAHADEPVRAEQILGKVIQIERAGKVIPHAQQLSGIHYFFGRMLDVDSIRSVAVRIRDWLGTSSHIPSKFESFIG